MSADDRETPGKRRLRLMPEVLPRPPERDVAAPRARTLDTMRRLMALATTTAVMGTACTKEGGEPPIRDEGAATAKSATASASASSATATPSATASAVPVPTATPPGPGYGVVDPLPAPAACKGFAAAVKATAVVKGTSVIVTLANSTRAGDSWSHAEQPTITGGTITKTTWGKSAMVVELTVTSGTVATLDVNADCGTRSEHVMVQVEITKPGSVKVTLYDGY